MGGRAWIRLGAALSLALGFSACNAISGLNDVEFSGAGGAGGVSAGTSTSGTGSSSSSTSSTSSSSSSSGTSTSTSTSSSSSSSSGNPCAPGEKSCNGACVPADVGHGCDGAGCAACPVGAHATGVSCVNGGCTVACVAGFTDCDGSPANGCESDLQTDPANCGACGRPCSGANVASKSCAGGLCSSTCASPSFANCVKPAAPAPDDGCEMASSTDPLNCGGCGVACNASYTCLAGFCQCPTVAACGFNAVACSAGVCECGAGTCVPGGRCSGGGGQCRCNGGANCAPGSRCCGPSCVPLSDPANCGGCGHACPPGFTCSGPSCACSGAASCDAGGGGACGMSGSCTCGVQSCSPGQRCQPGGVCG